MQTGKTCPKDDECPERCDHICNNPPEGFVEDDETLYRMLLNPRHYDPETGKVKKSAFRYSEFVGNGCSVHRKSKCSGEEYLQLVDRMDDWKRPQNEVEAILVVNAGDVRAVEHPNQAVMVCPSSRPNDVAHSDLFTMNPTISRKRWGKIRTKLKQLYTAVPILRFRQEVA